MTWFAINIGIIRKIGDEIAKPMRRFNHTLDYVPTQYICDYIKHLGYDGIKFKSTLVNSGTNYAFFNEKKFDCVYVKVVQIGNIDYRWDVLNLMARLLDAGMKDLSVDEAALLLMVACWHDTGMVVSKTQKEKLLSEDDEDIWDKYFRTHDEDKRRYNEGTADKRTLLPNLIRSIHPERVKEQLMETGLWYQWPEAIDKHIAREELFSVCKSHGEELQIINEIQPHSREVDLRVCAVLLRLAYILDFDYRRAPRSLYYYLGLHNPQTSEEQFSQMEWQKHMKSYGFDFIPVRHGKKIVEFSLLFNATCEDPTAHHKVNEYID